MDNKQIVYIDESNILSRTGNSVYVALFIEYLSKDYMGRKIENIEKDLKISYTHWVDMPWKLRIRFAEKIRYLDFNCKIVVYKNPINQKIMLENFLLKVLSSNDNIVNLIIDGKKSKSYENKLKNLLNIRGVKVYKVKSLDDKKEPILRLADFVAGLNRSFIDDRNDFNTNMNYLLKYKTKTLN